MELMKIVLFFISIACYISQQTEAAQAVTEPDIDLKINRASGGKGGCHGRLCNRHTGFVNDKRCTCFPLNNLNKPVLQHIATDSQDPLARTIVYIYNVGNKSAIYIPNLQKQSLFVDLTFDDGDIIRPLSPQNVRLLTAQDDEPPQDNEDQRRRADAHKNQPTMIQNLNNVDVPSSSEARNNEALKQILEGDLDVLVSNDSPNSQREYGPDGASHLYNLGKPQPVFNLNPHDKKYDYHVENPKPIMVSDKNNLHVHDHVATQKGFNLDFNAKGNYESDPTGNKLHSHKVNGQKNIVVPYDFAGSNIKNSGLKPFDKIIKFPVNGFGFDDNQNESQNSVKLEPAQSLATFDVNSDESYSYLYNFNRPSEGFKLKHNDMHKFDNAHRNLDFDLNSNEDYYLSLFKNAVPQSGLEFNSNGNNDILMNDMDKPQTIFGVNNLQPLAKPQTGFGFGSQWNNSPRSLKDIESQTNEKDLYLDNIFEPRKMKSEINGDNLFSASLVEQKPQKNIRCSYGICKLYIYCSRNDCPKYLQSLANLHTSIHKHPTLENTFIAMNNIRNNDTESRLKPFLNSIGLQDSDEVAQNIHSIQLEEQTPSLNHFSPVLSQQVPESIPPSFNPLVLDERADVQNLLSPGPFQEQLLEYYPKKKKIASKHRNLSSYQSLYFPTVVNEQYYRKSAAMSPGRRGGFLKDLMLLPSKMHHEGMKTLTNLIPTLSLRRNNGVDQEHASKEEVSIPVDEDEIRVKIIGGQPAVSSGTPMQIKARLGDA